jgi:hypothetical protein
MEVSMNDKQRLRPWDAMQLARCADCDHARLFHFLIPDHDIPRTFPKIKAAAGWLYVEPDGKKGSGRWICPNCAREALCDVSTGNMLLTDAIALEAARIEAEVRLRIEADKATTEALWRVGWA